MENQAREFVYCVANPRKDRTLITKEVKWIRPASGWVKLNTDRSYTAANGLSGCGGLIRDNNEQWITGFAKSINASSSIATELWALRDGLSICVKMHL